MKSSVKTRLRRPRDKNTSESDVIDLSTYILSSYVVIVRVRVVLKRTVFGDSRFDNLSGSHLQSQVNSVCLSMML